MTSKPTIGLVAAGLAWMALAPIGSANVDDDTLSLTFPYVSGPRIEVDGNGIGWYDAAIPPNVCLTTLLGLETPLIGTFYYETGRVFFNLPGFLSPATVLPSLFVPVPCPAFENPLCNAVSVCGLHIEPVTIGPTARTLIPQDGLACTQATSFITCIVTDAQWLVAGCPWSSASFAARSANENKGILLGTSLENFAFSQDIDCSAYAPIYDVSYLLGNSGDLRSSGFDGATATLIVPYGNGVDNTGFVVSCLRLTMTELDISTPIPTLTPNIVEDGVDWLLTLDLDAPGGAGWTGALVKQLGPGSNGQLLAGLYDLGGDNDCDFTAANASPLPTCHDGIDNDGDNYWKRDARDPQCYDTDPLTDLPFYEPTKNE